VKKYNNYIKIVSQTALCKNRNTNLVNRKIEIAVITKSVFFLCNQLMRKTRHLENVIYLALFFSPNMKIGGFLLFSIVVVIFTVGPSCAIH